MGVQEITRAMNQLDQVTQTNTASSEEAASAAEQLSAQATSLKNIVDLLMVTIKGGDSTQVGSSLPVKSHVSNYESNVVSIKTAPKKPTSPKTVHIKPATKTMAPAAKKVVGGGPAIPSGNDPRFEEV